MSRFSRFSPVKQVVALPGGDLCIWHPPDMDGLIDEAAFRSDERLPYWATVWDSAIVLAECLASERGHGRSLVEVGCGLGLPSLVAARQHFTVTATDYEPAALDGVRFNAKANGFEEQIETRLFDWRDSTKLTRRFDFMIASDVLYEPCHAAAIAAVIHDCLATDGVALVADPGRVHAEGFETACKRYGLFAKRKPARRPYGRNDGPEISVFNVNRS